jgi:hypothetical protein
MDYRMRRMIEDDDDDVQTINQTANELVTAEDSSKCLKSHSPIPVWVSELGGR